MTAGMVSMADVVEGSERWHVQHADCRFALQCLPDACVDAVVTDPPAGISFMGAHWDSDKGGRDEWIRWMAGVMREVVRVLKPGGHALVWALPRTSHWTATAAEDAGFQVRDVICHLFATGFPKSMSVSKAIDHAAGAEREVIGPSAIHSRGTTTAFPKRVGERGVEEGGRSQPQNAPMVTAPATPEAAQWEGWGTSLKPAAENWILARRPLDGTVAATVLKHGTGALNIDGCRVGSGGHQAAAGTLGGYRGASSGQYEPGTGWQPATAGRWPPNVAVSHSERCRRGGTKRVHSSFLDHECSSDSASGVFSPMGTVHKQGHADAAGLETVAAWECVPGCPVAALDAQSGECPAGIAVQRNGGGQQIFGSTNRRGAAEDSGYTDTGGASRFFPQFQIGEFDVPFYYTAKASTAERMAGLDERSVHPTVKSLALMQYLVRLVTPPGGLVLDPFTGSGSTGVAAMLEEGGFRFLGIEREPEYVAIAEQRIRHVAGGRWKTPQESAAEAVATGKKKQLTLF